MRQITLTQGYMAIVDDQDYEWLSQWRWYAHHNHHAVYAQRNSVGGHRTRTRILMHRVILGTAPGMETDHINGNGLDNRRANLRECSRQENMRNRRSQLGASSRFLGVGWDKQAQKWRAYIRVDGRLRYLGLYRVEAEAAAAYKAAAGIVHGEFAAGARGDRVEVSRW